MATEVILPRVDMDMSSGQISRWYVEEGAAVEKGQPLFEIETDKAAMEIEAPASGVLRNVSAAIGVSVPVGSTVAWIAAPGEAMAEAAAPAPENKAAVSVEPIFDTALIDAPPLAGGQEAGDATGDAAGVRATPLARRLARERGIDLATLSGSGPHGRIRAADIGTAAEPRTEAPTAELRTEAPPASPEAPARPAVAAAPRVTGPSELHRLWLRRGEGIPVVLIHGFGADLNGWRPFTSGPFIDRPILALDLPGHGKSEAGGDLSLDGLARAVEQAIEAEGIEALHLVGHSLGGAVAAIVAAQAACDVRSLLLISPAGLGPDINGAFLDGFTRARSEASLLPWMRELVGDPQALSAAFVKATARQREDGALADAQQKVAAALFPDGTQSFSIRPALERLAIPAKIVFGTDDRIIPARHAANLPGGIALHLFRSVGHLPQIEAREPVARLLMELVRAAG